MPLPADRLPRRIVCLTTETVEVLYALGAEDRIVGISGYTVRPPRARKEKPKVYAFVSGDLERILAVQPDLVLSFSDLQADITRDLIRAGVPVWAFNQRSVAGILDMVVQLGALVGKGEAAAALVADLEAVIEAARGQAARRIAQVGRRPRVYFEEWDEPLISGIRWVSELIDIAGGEDLFAEAACRPLARDRILADGAPVIAGAPDIIIGSWCGKHFRPAQVAARPGWGEIPAIRQGAIHEIKSAVILTPGPVAIQEGLPALTALFDQWSASLLTP